MEISVEIRVFWDAACRSWAWSVYQDAFREVNRATPCKQSLSQDEFMMALDDDRIQKWVVSAGKYPAGIGLITNDLECAPWVSVPYFRTHHSELFEKSLIYYLLGIAVDQRFSGVRPGKVLLDAMIGSLPENAAVVFDHSETANPGIPIFAKRSLPRGFHVEILDRQAYVMCRWA